MSLFDFGEHKAIKDLIEMEPDDWKDKYRDNKDEDNSDNDKSTFRF
ncbi:hypothetical protein [Risungbinella massiliensis]|nr:hypothetical protein [Risungbinella massiliensis]